MISPSDMKDLPRERTRWKLIHRSGIPHGHIFYLLISNKMSNNSDPRKVFLITGANQGLGFDAARQLSLLPETKKVYLACRSESKAVSAIDRLVSDHGILKEKLAFVLFEAADSREDITKAISLPKDEQFDGILFNAGGMGHDSSGQPVGPNNVVDMYQINLLGHIHLLDALKPYLIPHKTTIVVSGSEMARGLPSMGTPPPNLPCTVDEYKALMTGSKFDKFDGSREYGIVKAMAALYWAAWARQHPEFHVLTVSPGFTRGTSFGSHKSLPPVAKFFYPVLLAVTGVFGISQPLEQGAKIYVDSLTGQGDFSSATSGSFLAAADGKASGPLSDDQGVVFKDTNVQDVVFAAVQSFA